MSDDRPAFVDTNILVYGFDRSESRRRHLAAQLIEGLAANNRLRLSTQVLQEFFVTVTKKIKRPIPAAKALEVMDDLAVWPVFLIDYEAIREAGAICRKLKLSYRDTLILVAARRSNAEIVYSEDLNHGQTIHGVRILNPFV